MNNSQQYFFTVEKLEALIEYFRYKRQGSEDKKILRGFVFTPGEDNTAKRNPCCYAFPLYSDEAANGSIKDGDILVQNTSNGPGCPYPPPCRTFEFNGENCYGSGE